MKKILLLLCLTPLFTQSQSKKDDIMLKYSALTIPDSLKKDAHSVYRLDEATLDISSPGKYTYKVHQIITVLDKEGDHHLYQAHGTDKFNRVDDIEIKVFNVLGILKDKYKKKDFIVSAAFDGVSLVTDDKVMRFRIPNQEYPYTLEIEYTLEVTSFINLPSWYFQNPEESVEFSSFLVKVPSNLELRYKAKNIKINPQISDQNGKKTYLWQLTNLVGKKLESGSGEPTNMPYLLIASNQFEYDGYKGDLKDWASFGKWSYPFYQETKNPFSEQRRQEIKQLIADAKNDREKIRLLYHYLQKNMRYVSIQLGIGGFKPFPVSFVDEKKYGDCKALTNYMRYLLDEAGIKSYPALVKSGYNAAPMDTSFPRSWFDHVILCVPNNNDTVWLECTSNTSNFAVLGNFTENKYALLITEKGGVLVPTPRSKFSDNVFSVTTFVNLQEDGMGEVKTKFLTSGEYRDELVNSFLKEKKDDQKYYLVYRLGLKQPDAFEVSKDELQQNFSVNIDMQIEKIPEFVAGSKMFLNQRLYRLSPSGLPKAEDRKTDFLFECPFEKTDTTIFKLPGGFGVDVLPKEKQLKFEYGTYQTKHWFDEKQNSVITTARLILTQHRIPAAKYAETKKFFDEVLDDNNQKLVIKKL
jgi:hypothetical protein